MKTDRKSNVAASATVAPSIAFRTEWTPKPEPEPQPAPRGSDAFFEGWNAAHRRMADQFIDDLRSCLLHSIESQHLAIFHGDTAAPGDVFGRALRFALAYRHAEATGYDREAARLLAVEVIEESVMASLAGVAATSPA